MATSNWEGASADWSSDVDWDNGVPNSSGDAANIAGTETYAVTIEGGDVFTTNSTTLNDPNARLSISGSFDPGTLSIVAGTVDLVHPGTISGVINDPKSGMTFSGGTLDNAIYQGNLSLAADLSELNILNHLSVTNASGNGPGTIDVTGIGSHVIFLGTQTIDNVVVNIGMIASDGGEYFVDHDLLGGGETLTLGANFVLDEIGSARLEDDGSSGDAIVNDGTIESTDASQGGLNIAGNSFTNNGTFEASNGGTIDFDFFDFKTNFTNFSAGTLTGGTYIIDSGSELRLAASDAVTTLAATVTLDGPQSFLTDASTDNTADPTLGSGILPLDQALTTITAAGKLTISNGRDFTALNSITDAGSLIIDGGTFTAPVLTIVAGGNVDVSNGREVGPATILNGGEELVSSGGTAIGSIIETGGIEQVQSGGLADAATLAGGTLYFDAGAKAQDAVTFQGSGSNLVITNAASFGGTIGGFALGDTIDLVGDQYQAGVTGFTYQAGQGGGTLSILNGTTDIADLHLTGNYSATSFVLTKDASGTGTEILQGANYSASAGPVNVNLVNNTLTDSTGAQVTFASNEWVVGSNFNDVFTADAAAGVRQIDGGGGTNTLIESGVGYSQAQFEPTSNDGFVLSVGASTLDTTNIEEVQFIDGSVSFDPNSLAAETYRLYQAALGRAPDADGLAYWVGQAQTLGLNAVAQGFMQSAEYEQRFAAVSGNQGLVEQLYENVLGRQGDSTGISYWTNLLNTGQLSQAEVLTSFANIDENKANTAAAVAAGIWVINENAAEVARLYYSTLNRAPDPSGLSYWTNFLQTGDGTLNTVAQSFIQSGEFQTEYGSLSNQQFIDQLYLNVLHRMADNSGESFWTTQLNDGTSRSSVVVDFSESPEHKTQLVPKIEQHGVVFA